MGCSSTNFSREELVNSMKNGVLIQQVKLNQTQKESLEALDYLKNNVSLNIEKHKYSLFGDIELKTSVSESAKRKSGKREISVNPDNEIKRQGGTFIHEVLKDLVDYYANHNGDSVIRNTVRDKALSGATKLHGNNFDQLSKLAKSLVDTIQEQQKQIDPKGKVEIRTEAFVADFLKDIGGMIDVVAIFSDNTASIYDYKNTSRGKAIQGEEVVDNLFPYYELGQYDLSMSEYKRILLERIGVKSIRQNRLLPIAVSYKYKKEGEIGEKLLPDVNTLLAYQPSNDFMKPVPVGAEGSRWEGITKLVEKQLKLQTELVEKLKKGGLTAEQKKHLQDRIDNINRSVMKTLVDEDINDLLGTVANLSIEAQTRLKEVQTLPNGEDNPAYLSLEDLDNFGKELATYSDITNETHSYFSELRESNPEQYNRLKEGLNAVRNGLQDAATAIAFEFTNRAEEAVKKEYKDENGHLLPMQELSPGQLIFAKISEINNPVFNTIWKVIEDAQYDIKKKFEDMDKSIWGTTDALHKWAHDNHMHRMDAYKIMINEKTGNMYAKLDSEFYKRLQKALEDKSKKGIDIVHDNFDFRDKEAFKKDYVTRLEGFKAVQKAKFNNLATVKDTNKYKKSIETWIDNNDLINSRESWLNDSNRKKYLELKQSVVEANYSTEYRKIQSIKPLKEFYDMWTEKMEQFADILGITNYYDLPPNFIPNIRKDVLEHLSSDGLHIAAGIKEMMESFNVREEDIYRGTSEKRIPILFTNKFFTKDGKVDNNRKSYDLSKSLRIFGHMAYSYQHMNEIEPKINALKSLIGNPTPEQGGIESTDRMGRRIKGRIQPYLTKEGRMTETYKLLDEITDCYLYGIKFTEKSLIPGMDTVHFLTKAKNYNSVVKLSFAITPALGAYIAGKFGTRFNAKKGIAYTTEQLNHATKIQVTDTKLYQELTKFFDAENDSYLDRAVHSQSFSAKNNIISSRTGFAPLRLADKHITNHILVSMAQNYGVTKDGGIMRLNRNGIDNTQYKTILESLKTDEKGNVSIEGLSKQGFIQFRAATKAAAGEIIGNMNADDLGKGDVNLLINQMMAFKSWLPALVQEYTGSLRWDETSQAMRWGRFASWMSDYSPSTNYTTQELETGKYMYSYLSKVILPNMGKLILDISTFGLAPTMGMKRINEVRAQREFLKWQVKNPGLRETVSFDDFLEIKEGQMKAMLMQMRVIIGFMALAMFLGGKGDDDKRPRYMQNYATRNLYKIFSKAGSELTFMWNPSEFIRIMKNPIPVTGLLTQLKNTVFNGFDESRDLMVGENKKNDPTPAGYYMMQWIPGEPQLARFLEIYKSMEKSQYQVYSSQTN